MSAITMASLACRMFRRDTIHTIYVLMVNVAHVLIYTDINSPSNIMRKDGSTVGILGLLLNCTQFYSKVCAQVYTNEKLDI